MRAVASEDLLYELDDPLVSGRREDKPNFIVAEHELVTAARVLDLL